MSEELSKRVELVIPAPVDNERVDRMVSMLFGVTRVQAKSLISSEKVLLNGSVVRKPSQAVSVGDDLICDIPEFKVEMKYQPEVEFEVVHADDSIIVINKPAGLVVHPGSGNTQDTLVNGLLAQYPEIKNIGEIERPGIVHRLDKDTSGLMVVARCEESFQNLKDQLKSRSVTRQYHCLVEGIISQSSGAIEAPVGRSKKNPRRQDVIVNGKYAFTSYEVLARYKEHTLIKCSLKTGRMHQIRVHMESIWHSVVGDRTYGGIAELLDDRIFLHAKRLAFVHPIQNKPDEFESQLPERLQNILEGLAE